MLQKVTQSTHIIFCLLMSNFCHNALVISADDKLGNSNDNPLLIFHNLVGPHYVAKKEHLIANNQDVQLGETKQVEQLRLRNRKQPQDKMSIKNSKQMKGAASEDRILDNQVLAAYQQPLMEGGDEKRRPRPSLNLKFKPSFLGKRFENINYRTIHMGKRPTYEDYRHAMLGKRHDYNRYRSSIMGSRGVTRFREENGKRSEDEAGISTFDKKRSRLSRYNLPPSTGKRMFDRFRPTLIGKRMFSRFKPSFNGKRMFSRYKPSMITKRILYRFRPALMGKRMFNRFKPSLMGKRMFSRFKPSFIGKRILYRYSIRPLQSMGKRIQYSADEEDKGRKLLRSQGRKVKSDSS